MTLSDSHRRVLRASLDRIIPADDDPGACDAGVDAYVERQLQGDLRHLSTEFLAGLERLDAEARAKFDKDFADIGAERQDEILARLDEAKLTDAGGFFSLLVRLANEGFYSDPSNGGNRNEISWKMIGYEPRPFGRQSKS